MTDELMLPQNDHDLLITMAATSKLGIADLKADIAQVNTNLAELKGNFTSQFSSLDVRITSLEQLRDQINPLEVIKDIKQHSEFISDYKSSHKERNAIIQLCLTILSILIAIVAAFSRLIFH